ncbi:transcription antitermination factor NusB [Nocardioides sp.]|uniref:transcription antitermination factor NusB n=1 Tax=Nocardioides sp. TaxID=35761 RepID=UPI0035281621
MAARSKARKRALDHLYACELRGEDPVVVLDTQIEAGDPPNNPYTAELVRGVSEHRARIDELLEGYSQGWSLARMPAVDRNVLRIGAFELLYSSEIPDEVAVSEAMALVRELSTDESPVFVNGVLGAMQRDKDQLVG